MEKLICKTRKNVNIKEFLISHGLANSMVSFEIRSKCTGSDADVLSAKYNDPIMQQIQKYTELAKVAFNPDSFTIIPYSTLGLHSPMLADRAIGLLYGCKSVSASHYSASIDSIPNDLIYRHGHFMLYITEITNEEETK